MDDLEYTSLLFELKGLLRQLTPVRVAAPIRVKRKYTRHPPKPAFRLDGRKLKPFKFEIECLCDECRGC